jgi:hypothetical protein
MPKRKKPDTKELTRFTPEELEIEKQTGYRLTMRQKKFAERFSEGNITATGAAREAGYAPSTAAQQAGRMLNPQQCPQVVAYLNYLRDELQARYGVTREGMLKRLYDLSRGAEENGQYSAAIVSEKTRASLAGLTIDRRETINTVNDLSKAQVIERLEELKRKHPGAFEVIEGTYTEPQPIEDARLIDVSPDED